MEELSPTSLKNIGFFLLVWSPLLIALVIRYVVLKKRLEKGTAFFYVFFFWLFNFTLFHFLGTQSKSHAVHIIVAIISYWILRAKSSPNEEKDRSVEINKASADGTTRLMEAAMLGRIKQIQEMILAGANLDAVDEQGWTALMYAASQDEVEAIELLLRNGANHYLVSNDGETAAGIAFRKGYLDTGSLIQAFRFNA